MENNKLKELVKELVDILETTEVSDSGAVFHPTTIKSCRCMVAARLADLMLEIKKEL